MLADRPIKKHHIALILQDRQPPTHESITEHIDQMINKRISFHHSRNVYPGCQIHTSSNLRAAKF